LRAGISYVSDVTNGDIDEMSTLGYIPTDDYTAIADFDIAVITVPTPLFEGAPDLRSIEAAAASVAPHLTSGATVILESTTYPGTTRNILVPILERGSGLSVGTDFYVGYSPERIDPGNLTWTLTNTPKVISGLCERSLESVRGFYARFIDSLVPVSRPEEAELVKLLENTFRHVNIALVNELATFSHELKINLWESIEAAATKPFGFMKFTPGPGVGGHCLPVDPTYLSWHAEKVTGKKFRFIEEANRVNDIMPGYTAERALAMLDRSEGDREDASVLVVGLAYKENTSDLRESPALKVLEVLRRRVAKISAFDDEIPDGSWPTGVVRVRGHELKDTTFDLAVVLTIHDNARTHLENLRSRHCLVARNGWDPPFKVDML